MRNASEAVLHLQASIIQTLTVKGSKMPVSYKHSQRRGQRCQYHTNTHSEGGQRCQYHTNTHSEGVKDASIIQTLTEKGSKMPVSYKHSQWRGQRCQYNTNTHSEGVKDASIIQTLTVKGVKDASIIQTLTVKGSKMPVSYKRSQWRGQRCQYNTNTHSEGVKYASIIQTLTVKGSNMPVSYKHSQWRGQICQWHWRRSNLWRAPAPLSVSTPATSRCSRKAPGCHKPLTEPAQRRLTSATCSDLVSQTFVYSQWRICFFFCPPSTPLQNHLQFH